MGGIRVLSIDGGGYLGLATAAFIDGVEDHLRQPFHRSFDLFCGTSTGAILALGLASGKTGKALVELYKSLGTAVFPSSVWTRHAALRLAKMFCGPLYRSEPLAKALRDAFGETTLGDLRAAGKKVLIPAFCVTTGRPRIFKTDHSSNLTRHDGYRLWEVALASAAAPLYFPVVAIREPKSGATEGFCDGGVVANHPALLGFAEACHELAAAPEQIALLSLATPRQDLSERGAGGMRLRRGLLGWRSRLASVVVDSGAIVAHEVMLRIIRSYPAERRPLYQRVEMENRAGFTIDCADARTTEALIHLGTEKASSNTVRDSLVSFFREQVSTSG